MNSYKLIFVQLALLASIESFSMSQKRKLSNDGFTHQDKKRKTDASNAMSERSLSIKQEQQVTAIKQLNDALSRCRTNQNWDKRKNLIIEAYNQHHIDLNQICYKHQFSLLNPLSDAIDQSDEQFVRWLLTSGMHPHHLNALELPVISYAKKIGIVHALLEAGAKLDGNGESLALYAVMKGYDPELIQLYGAYGFAGNETSRPGETPLSRLIFHAAGYRTKDIESLKAKGRFLIENGANTVDPIYNGKTFDQLVKEEIALLEAQKVHSNKPERYSKDIAKISALSAAVHEAEKNQPKRIEDMKAEVNKNLSLFPQAIRQLIGEYSS